MNTFKQQLDEIKADFVHLCSDVESLLTHSLTNLKDDHEKIKSLKSLDHSIDEQEMKIEKKCQEFLALHQPVASDLRFVLSILKATNYLERIADLSINIARRNFRIPMNERIHNLNISEIIDVVIEMLRLSIDALLHERSDIAYQVIKKDEEVDEFKARARQMAISQIKKDSSLAEIYIDLLFNARNLERIADLATNIAEDAVYLVEGKIIRHSMSI